MERIKFLTDVRRFSVLTFFILSLSALVLMAVYFIELFPQILHSPEKIGGILLRMVVMACGCALIMFRDKGTEFWVYFLLKFRRKSTLLKTGKLIGASIGLLAFLCLCMCFKTEGFYIKEVNVFISMFIPGIIGGFLWETKEAERWVHYMNRANELVKAAMQAEENQ